MPYAEFQPQSGRDLFGDNVALMSKIDANARANADEQRQQAQFQALQPVLHAKAQADVASAQASVANAARLEQFRAQAATESPELNAQFLDAMKLPSFEEQSKALAELQGKVSYMEVLPEYKGFVDTVNNARAQAHASNLANMHIEAQTQIAQGAVAAKERMAEANLQLRAQMQQNAIDAKAALETQAAQHKKELEGVKSEYVGVNAANKARAVTAEKSNEAAVQAGIAVKQPLDQINTALQLLDDPDVRTGTGADLQLKLERIGQLVGADVKGVSKTEQLNSILGQTVLDKAKLLKGAIAAKELSFLQNQAPTISKSPEGIKLMLHALQKGYQNQLNIARLISEGRAEGKSSADISNEAQQYAENNSVFDQGPSPAASASPGAAPADGATFTPEKERRLQELRAKLGR